MDNREIIEEALVKAYRGEKKWNEVLEGQKQSLLGHLYEAYVWLCNNGADDKSPKERIKTQLDLHEYRKEKDE